jgi:amino acid adenylation domain-containing protein
VREVVVKFAPAPPVPRILAWVQSDETGAAFAEGIRLQLKTRLPAYMIPSRIYCVPEIPLNINGKVDIDRLDSKEGDVASEGPPQRTETSSPIQTLLREVFEISLGHTDFENSDSFFEFGGDSISVLSLIGLAGKRGLLLKVEDVWKYPSVSLLTQRIDTAGFALAKSLPLSGMIATGRSPIARLPMTELQIGMILETIRSGELAPYHDLFLYTINGYLDPIRFTAAVYSVCARAAVLRSRFDLGAIDGPQQTFSANIDKIVEYLEVDPGALDKVAQIRAEFWMAADLLRGWDYAAGPLFRCAVTLESGTHQARYLCISFHHAILDGWSVSALIGELLRTYDHGSISVEDAPIGSFADYVNLERVALNNESARAFWRNYVQSNAIRHIPLVPISFKPCERQAFADRYPAASVPITTSQIERVNRRATRCRCLPKTIFLAAAALTNSMYSNGERSLFGLVTNGRPPTVSKLGLPDLGLFLNVIPFAVDTRTGTSLDLISRCHEGEVEILPWRLYPYSGMTKDAGQQVVNLVFNYTDFTAYDDASKEASIKITKIEYFERTEFDLLLYVSRDLGTAGWHARVSFNQERFTQQFAENFIQTYVQVLEDLTNPASLRLDEISPWGHICTESNRETKTEKPFFLDDFFAQSRHHWREVAAICDSGKTFTYEELDGRALAIASLLRAKGVGPGDIVPICLPRGGKQVVCILGVLRTGAAFLQLDPSLPAPSRHKLLTRAPFSVLITDGRSAADFQDQLVLVVDRDGLPVDSSSASNVSKYPSQAPQRADTDAAYAVFTSGSTGLPKLVIISHRSICTLVSWHVRAFQDAGTRPTALVATVGFDVSVQEIFVALAWGSMLVTVPDEVRSQPRSLLDFLERNKVARLFFPTALLIQLGVDYESLSNKGLHLKEIFVAGERLRVDAGFRKLFAAMPQCILVNQYGPSETHVVASQTMMGPSEAWPTLPPIGRPIMGSGVFIGDHQGRLLPPESIGQIWITGASVGMGYLSNWEATRSVFSCWNGQRRAFITQDLGFVDVRGLLHCVGRTDECVKHAGYLVSLSNVETAIAALPGIRAVSVVAVGESGSSQKLVAFVVTSDRLARGALRAALCAEHPSYVVPDAFIQVESLPMTGNGKIDKRGLILRAAHASDQRTEFDGDVEKCIAEIWRSRTGVSVMADDVGFFDAGGSSLDAVQVVTLINQRFGIELEFVEFFSLANIKRIAHRVRELSIGATARQEPAQMRRRRERLSGSLKHNSREDRNG